MRFLKLLLSPALALLISPVPDLLAQTVPGNSTIT